ncbi:MAG: signal peptidase II [Holosporaceae bacterium]|nr:signal peptidase II [Holosporaceae bacterium]
MSTSISSSAVVLIIFFVVLGDQISKFLVVKFLHAGECAYIWPFFNFVNVKNSGITFGLLNGIFQPIVFVAISLIIVASFCVWIKNNDSYRLPSSLIIGGAIGNLIDRIIHQAVIDFLDFHLLTYHWPAFNIADSAIVIGGSVMFFISYREEKR